LHQLVKDQAHSVASLWGNLAAGLSLPVENIPGSLEVNPATAAIYGGTDDVGGGAIQCTVRVLKRSVPELKLLRPCAWETLFQKTADSKPLV